MANGRRGRSGWLLGLIVILALLWGGYWYAAHYFAEAAIARVTAQPINGKRIACSETALGGFPLSLDFRCGRGTYADTRGDATAAIGGLTASAPLYWPGSVEAKLDAPLTMNVPGRAVALTVNWSRGDASASAGLNGLQGASAAFVSLKAENSGPLPGLGAEALTADAASASLAPAADGAYAIAGSTKRLALTRDGSTLPEIDADIKATALHVGPLGADPARAFLAWLRGTPDATIERLRIAMGGAIVAASGTLSLSEAGLLNGSILLRYNSIEALGNLIEMLRPGTREKYEVALQGLQAMSQPVQSEDGPALQTQLTFTDGMVWLAIFPLPIDPIPPLRF